MVHEEGKVMIECEATEYFAGVLNMFLYNQVHCVDVMKLVEGSPNPMIQFSKVNQSKSLWKISTH